MQNCHQIDSFKKSVFCSMRAKTRRQSPPVPPQLETRVRQLKFSTALSMHANNHESVASTDLGITNELYQKANSQI